MFEPPEGFTVPVYHGLQRPPLLAGAPRRWTIMLVVLAGIALLWHAWSLIPLAIVLHGLAVWGTRQDDQWFAILWASLRQATFYEG